MPARGIQAYLSCLVLSNFMHGVLSAVLALAVGLSGFWDVDLMENECQPIVLPSFSETTPPLLPLRSLSYLANHRVYKLVGLLQLIKSARSRSSRSMSSIVDRPMPFEAIHRLLSCGELSQSKPFQLVRLASTFKKNRMLTILAVVFCRRGIR